MNKKRLLIVGGVAGGASCAARARRLSENAEIIIFERGPYVSFANCGLPYYVGQLIEKEKDLLVATPSLFKKRFNIDVRTQNNVTKIDRENREIEIENLKNGEIYREAYDALVLSPGSMPFKPNIEGINLPGVYTLWTIPDMREIIEWTKAKTVKHAVVIGGGFIGLEMTENLKRIGINVSIVEMLHQVMPSLDPEMASFIHAHLKEKGVDLHLGNAVSGIKKSADNRISLCLTSGSSLTTDMVILAAGVRPRVELAEGAELKIGSLGGIVVNDHMQTSDPHIWAVGDAVEINNFISRSPTRVPLAGPANRQGRIAADAICGSSIDDHLFRGSQATAVCGIMGMTVASTGLTEKALRSMNNPQNEIAYEKVYLHPDHHAGYYPGAETITIKLLFSKKDGRVLGAQALGLDGVEKRIDVIAMAIQKSATVFDLEESELCYAPQYGSAKDPINLAGMIAANNLRGYSSIAHWDNLNQSDALVLDVRNKDEYDEDHVKGAVHIPLNDLRKHMSELPLDREIWVYCLAGVRSYFAERILVQSGFNVRNLSGGHIIYLAAKGMAPLL